MDVNSIEYLAESPYPPTALGRYARWHQKESWRSPGEPIDRIGCVWTVESRLPERKADLDYCACIECGPEGGRVLIGWGHPRDEERPWLPARWPAGLFPLGVSRAHLLGWRGLVLAAVSYNPEPPYNYVPKVRWGYPRGDASQDDWECGWLPLVRATRLLAHHLHLIASDRLLAPYPATRNHARPDVEPILDELVRFASVRATIEPSPASRPEKAVLLPAHGHAQPDCPRWDAESRTLYFGDRLVKRYDRHPANAQTPVLQAFESAGWPDSITFVFEEGQRGNTIRGLNKSLGKRTPITFHGTGTGDGVRWQRKQRRSR